LAAASWEQKLQIMVRPQLWSAAVLCRLGFVVKKAKAAEDCRTPNQNQ
jgi:hypothetical protein